MLYPVPTTWSPTDKGTTVSLYSGNLTAICQYTGGTVRSVHGAVSGKYYWEVNLDNLGIVGFVGVQTGSATYNNGVGGDVYGWGYYTGGGTKYHSGDQGAYGAVCALNDVIGVALDMDAGTLEFFRNGITCGVAFTGITGTVHAAFSGASNGVDSSGTANFGATAFAYTPPAGFYWGFGPLGTVGSAGVEISLSSILAVGYSGPQAAISMPAMRAVGYSPGTGRVVLPMATLSSQGHDATGENAADIVMPTALLAGGGGANCATAMPALTATATATGTNSGRANALTCPAFSVSASGTVSAGGSASLTVGSGTDTYSLIGYSGAVCSVTLSGRLTVLASGSSGVTGSAAITLPLFDLTAAGTVTGVSSADLVLPMPTMGVGGGVAYLVAPGFTLIAIGHAVVTATYEAYAVNLKHQPKPGNEPVDEVTRYTNFPFTHIVRYKNSYFGANSTGLYLLDGTTDYASPTPTPIPWAFKTAMTDFKSPFQKTVASAYFGGRLGAAATIDLHVGEDGPQTYSYATVRTDHAQNYRQVFGKGTKARYYALGASGTGTLELDDIDLDVHTLSRRI